MRHRDSPPLPAGASGAVSGRIIPQNKAVKRYLAATQAEGKRHLIYCHDGRVIELPYTLHDLAERLGQERSKPSARRPRHGRY